jgi:acyl-CoA reductase-like NAD-dependent aldehyde dehydrogenase
MKSTKGTLMTNLSAPTIQHYINGRVVASTSGRQQDVFNPATGEVSGQVALASVEEVNSAVACLGRDRAAEARAHHVEVQGTD